MSKDLNEFKCGCSKSEDKQTLAECEDWEVNKKKKLEEIIAGDNCPRCVVGDDGKCGGDGIYFAGKNFSCCEIHNDPTKGKVVTIRSEIWIGGKKISDERPCNLCQNKNNNQSRERERDILNYFKSNNIKSITLKDNNLVIEYNNSQMETKDINTSELQVIRSYCQVHNLNTLSFSDLQQTTQNPSGFNWKSPWVIGGGIILVVGIVGLVVYLVNRKRKDKE